MHKLYRGYYMTVRRYEFYLRVFNSISHEWVQRTSEMSSSTQEYKIHTYKRACNICFYINILMMTFLMIFQRFPKIFQNNYCSEEKTNVSEHFPDIFWRLLKISKEGLMMFWSYSSNTSKYFLRDYVTIAIVIILVTMATPISSHVKDKNSIFIAWDEDVIF